MFLSFLTRHALGYLPLESMPYEQGDKRSETRLDTAKEDLLEELADFPALDLSALAFVEARCDDLINKEKKERFRRREHSGLTSWRCIAIEKKGDPMDKPLRHISLAEEKATLLITLYAKAFDNRSKHSLLHDTKADEIASQIAYDFTKLAWFGRGNLIVLRAKHLDEWLQAFLKANPQGVVLQLGCGLDTRITRINPEPSVSWFDLDYPEVITLRQQFYANRDGYTMIGSSVTDVEWLVTIPKDRPIMIIAEGLLEYLAEEEVSMLLTRLTDAFPVIF